MAHHQPKVQVLIVQQDKGILYESPSFPKHFWNINFTDILQWPFTKSTDQVVSNLKIILLTVIGLVLLWTLYRILKRLGNFISSLWVQSEPNEWLVVIRNGNFVKAGVGLKTFIGPWDSVVTFPSKVERISFLANNVTLEMQGVNINGVAFWSVHREEDGPFKCYKYMQGGDANQNVKTMCESILRNLIANSKLEDVLRKRDLMKDTMRKELEKPLKGWGIWLESVEITQVRISSKTLFQEMQAQFRNQTKIKAQKSQFEAQEKINEEREKTQLKISQLHQQNQTKKDQQSLTQQLQRIKQKNHYDTENDKFQLEKLQRNKKLEMQRLRLNQEEEEEKLKNQLKIKKERDEYQEDKARRKIQIDSLYKDTSLIKYQIDAMERIYQALGIQEMKINQFVTGNEQTDLGKLLPTLSLINSLPTVTK